MHIRKNNLYNYKVKYINGFTFVELIVSIGVMLILVGLAIFILDPLKQINKSMNARRLADLSSFTSIFETYYNDHQHFPASVPFGSIWQEGTTVYMSKTPQDPQGRNNNGGYLYMTDGSSTPQWGVVFSKLSDSSPSPVCELTPDCAPAGYNTNQWSCKVFGTVDCSSITTQSLPGTTIIAQGTQSNGTNTNVPANASPAPTGTTNQNSMTQVTLCHYNSANNYTQETTGATSNVGGHDGHTNDIIPPFTYSCTSGSCSYPGKNWTTGGQTTYNNNCVVASSTSMPAFLSYTGSDGSTCEEATPPNSYVDELHATWWCKDSTGFDSTKDGVNSCQVVSGQAAIYRFPCVPAEITDPVTHQATTLSVRCLQQGVGYSFNYQTWKWESVCTEGWPNTSSCQNNACVLASTKTSVAPVIKVISPTDYSTMSYPSAPSVIDVVIRLVSSSDTLRYFTMEDDEGQGGGGTSCTQINATDWDCGLMTWPKSLRNGNPVRTIHVFAVDNSGNTGYAVTHVNLQ